MCKWAKCDKGRKSQACLFEVPPQGPATFPPISGLPMLGRPERYSWGPSGFKLTKPNTGKKAVMSKTRESELVVKEDNASNREPDCPQCPLLQKEIDDLKDQLAVMQWSITKLYIIWS
ncbi:PREDICTED: uncharacterized protein CXorf49 homolog [Chrysochloris asiatica]|uniref:Uncharacterized protein CXorf49 homolog n=1 Tax=Chrysochloris asiatica TaxID=185453 RepID=A0A9B0U2Q1_CHRAS|nr:PREDICTED: uncharacterized protein CXorf49 homolog [Chrysochloris asiatica]